MRRLATGLLILVVITHVGFSIAEIFLWQWPPIHSGVTYKDPASNQRVGYDEKTAPIATDIVANAGIYNAFIAAGLFWGLIARKRAESIRRFFLWCIVIAGLFGAFTLWSWVPLLLQTVLGGVTLFILDRTRPKPHWELGREYPPLDEQADIEEVVRIGTEMQIKGGRPIYRGQHAKMIGGLRARFAVVDPTDARARAGIFEEKKVYDAIVRFSNGVGRIQPDAEKDARGMAIKILGVTGPRCLDEDGDHTTQDFVMINFPAFPVRDAEQYVTFMALRQFFMNWPGGKKLAPLAFFIPWHLKQFFTVGKKLQKASSSVLDEQYWSMSAYRLGTHAIKFSAEPQERLSKPTPAGEKLSDDFLKDELIARVGSKDVRFDFWIQFQTDPYTTPVEDPTVIWTEDLSKPVKVAEIIIEKSDLTTEDAQRFMQEVDNLAFNPWHSLIEHQPLGGINRLRKAVYQASTKMRRQHS